MRNSASDTRYLVVSVILLSVVTSLPPLTGWWMARSQGLTYVGLPLLNTGDLGVYLHYIRQVEAGNWAFRNPLMTGVGTPVVNILWLAVGWLGELLGTASLVTYHTARLLLLLPLVAAARWTARQAFVQLAEQRIATTLLLFGTGFGGWVALLKGPTGRLPTDVEVAEFTAIGSAFTSPHLVASWVFFLVTVPLALSAVAHRSLRSAFRTGRLSGVWFQFHPFYAPLVWALTVGAALWQARHDWHAVPWRPALLVIAGGLPSVAYHAPLVLGANQEWMLDSNTLPAEPIAFLLVAFGGMLFAAPRGYRILRTQMRDGRVASLTPDLLILWAVIQGSCAYLPLGFERRLLQGMIVPVTLLAAPAVLAIWQRWGEVGVIQRYSRWPLAAATFGSGTLLFFLLSMRGALETRDSTVFLSGEVARLIEWCDQHLTQRDILLAPPNKGYLLAGWGGATVYVAEHWTQSRTERTRTAEVAALYRNRDPEQIAAFLRSRGIRVLYVGPEERALGGAVERIPGLRLLFRAGERVLWGIP